MAVTTMMVIIITIGFKISTKTDRQRNAIKNTTRSTVIL